MNLDHHPKRGVLKDIDKSSLLRMRQDGMTNQEIADACECCYTTVVRIIGKQPPKAERDRYREQRRQAKGSGDRVEITQTAPVAQETQHSAVQVESVVYRGELGTYTLTGGVVDLRASVNLGALDGLIAELRDLKMAIGRADNA